MHPVSRPRRLLLTEDDLSSKIILTLMLQRLGFEVFAVSDSRSAVSAFQTGNFDFVVLDLILPDRNGNMTAEEIRAFEVSNHRPRTPILALTASPSTETRSRCLASGITDWITKPVSTFQLALAIERCQTSEQMSAPSPAVKGEAF